MKPFLEKAMVRALAGALLVFWFGALPASAKFMQLDLAVDVKSRFSDGCSTVQELALKAGMQYLDGLILADHDVKVLEYGLWPLEGLLKKWERQPALLSKGVSGYLADIRQSDGQMEELLVMPGVESAPHYYWTGSPFKNNLVAHNWDKHLLIVGLLQDRDYEQLPVLHGAFSMRYLDRFLPLFLVFCAASLAGLVLLIMKKHTRVAWVLLVLGLPLAANHHPFRSSPYSAYQGDPGPAPYQEVIDYATGKGALVFWNHLEWPTAMGQGNPGTKLDTPPHPDDLLRTHGYTGFQAVGDREVASVGAGREWDQVLQQYLEGRRDWPVWGIGTADYHCESENGPALGGVRTVVLVRSRDPISVQDALRTGRTYAVRQGRPDSRLSLDEFLLKAPGAGESVTLGEELLTEAAPEIQFQLRSTGGTEKEAIMTLIRDGKILRQSVISLPYEFRLTDQEVTRSGAHYYRLLVDSGPDNRLVSNPLFVRFGNAGPQVASVPPPAAAPPPPAPPPAPAAPTPPPAPEAKPVPDPVVSAAPVAAAPPAPVVPAPAPAPAPAPPQVAAPPAPAPPPAPPAAPAAPAMKQVAARIEGLSLYQKPTVRAPVVAKVPKGERLDVVRRTDVKFNKKAWLEVKRGDQTAFVWEGFVKDL